MKYEELYDEFIGLFPEDEEFFSAREKETAAERSDGMHIMFGMVVCPFILLIPVENSEKIQRAFDFIEQMETSGDSDIANVAEVTVLEYLMTDENGGMEKFGRFLGAESMETVKHMSKYLGIDMKTRT